MYKSRSKEYVVEVPTLFHLQGVQSGSGESGASAEASPKAEARKRQET